MRGNEFFRIDHAWESSKSRGPHFPDPKRLNAATSIAAMVPATKPPSPL
jgi:hypothetical protein